MIWTTFEGFVLLDSHKGVFDMGKMPRGVGRAKNVGSVIIEILTT